MPRKSLIRMRGELNWTQAELATELEIDPTTVSRYERGCLKIPKTVLLAVYGLALKMGKDIDWLTILGVCIAVEIIIPSLSPTVRIMKEMIEIMARGSEWEGESK